MPWWRTRILLVVVLVVLPVAVAAVLLAPVRGGLLAVAAVLLGAGVGSALVLPACWYRVTLWEVGEHAVYTRSGYLWTTWRIAPLSRIQTIDTTRGPLQKRFAVVTVVVTTASSAGAVRIAGLDEQLAAVLTHQLSQLTDATPGDAT